MLLFITVFNVIPYFICVHVIVDIKLYR